MGCRLSGTSFVFLIVSWERLMSSVELVIKAYSPMYSNFPAVNRIMIKL